MEIMEERRKILAITYRLVPATEQSTTTWSGGTTTELAIYPPGASYAARDFAWRLSTAIVTAATSTFTALPGWHRSLMVLSGQMHLEHTGQHQVTLAPFEQDSFSGSWLTHCTGTGQDFNLMLAAGWQGCLQALHITPADSLSLELSRPITTEAFYCVSGCIQVSLPGPTVLILEPGDFLFVESDPLANQRINLSANTSSALVRASIGRE